MLLNIIIISIVD